MLCVGRRAAAGPMPSSLHPGGRSGVQNNADTAFASDQELRIRSVPVCQPDRAFNEFTLRGLLAHWEPLSRFLLDTGSPDTDCQVIRSPLAVSRVGNPLLPKAPASGYGALTMCTSMMLWWTNSMWP